MMNESILDEMSERHATYLIKKYGKETGNRVFDAVAFSLDVWIDVIAALGREQARDAMIDVAKMIIETTNTISLNQ